MTKQLALFTTLCLCLAGATLYGRDLARLHNSDVLYASFWARDGFDTAGQYLVFMTGRLNWTSSLSTRQLSRRPGPDEQRRGGRPHHRGDNWPHAGVWVYTTYRGGTAWLIHKGYRYGHTSHTQLIEASQISSEWTPRLCGTVHGHTVSDFLTAAEHAGDPSSLAYSNCITSAWRMWRLVSEVRC